MISNIKHTLEDRLQIESNDLKWLVSIATIALAVRVAWVLATLPMPGWDAAEYDGLAWRLATGEGYVDSEGKPTAYRPVGYPAFLSVIYAIFGHSWLAGYIANAILSTFTATLTYWLAREFVSSRLSLIVAGVIALLPSHISYTTFMSTESIYAVFVLATLIATVRLARYPHWKNAALLGIIIGVSVYMRPTLLMFPIVAAVLLLMRISGVNISK